MTVLKVISSSPGALTPVFDAMLQNAVSICEAKFGVMFRFDGDVAYVVAMLNLPPALDEYLRQRGRRPTTRAHEMLHRQTRTWSLIAIFTMGFVALLSVLLIDKHQRSL
jgi:hypothetical protein